MKKGLIVCLIALSFSGTLALPAHADLVVYDPSAVAQMIQNVAQTLQQIQLMQQNLQAMDPNAAAASAAQIQASLGSLINMQQQVQGMVMDYQRMQQQWDATYMDFGSYNGMTATDYAQNMMNLLTQTNSQIYDAMRAQGLVSQIGADVGNLQKLVTVSQNAQGALAAAQVANQIAALQTQQMMRLQQMMAESNQAQAAYYKLLVDKDAQAKAASDKFFNGSVQSNPLQQDSQGSGVGRY